MRKFITSHSALYAVAAHHTYRFCSQKPASETQTPSEDNNNNNNTNPSEDIVKLREELKKAQEEATLNKTNYLYALAEMENVRRIGRDDVEKARSFGISSFGKDMIEVMDVLERAVESFDAVPKDIIAGDKALASILTGVKMSNSVLLKNLSKHEIVKMDVKKGDVFNPNMHEALFKAPATAEAPADHLLSVFKCGYMIKERVLRAAQVGVAEPVD